METRPLGQLSVSVVGLGCNNFGMKLDVHATRSVVDAAIESGVTYFDTAESYGDGRSEEFLGAALRGRRDEVIVATKWGNRYPEDAPRPGTRTAVRRAVAGSLRRLATDRIDHYQLHRPDPDTPIVETLTALAELRDEGMILEIGCSNFSAAQLDDAAAVADELGVPSFASVQNHYSLLTRTPEHDGVLDACARHDIAFVPFFPLESGVLTGKYRSGEPPAHGTRLATWGDRGAMFTEGDRLDQARRLADWAEARGHTLLELAMSWLVGNPRVASVICGATSPEQVRANVAAAAWTITDDERADLEGVLAG